MLLPRPAVASALWSAIPSVPPVTSLDPVVFFQAKVSAAFLLKTQTSKIRRLDVNRPLLFGGCGQGSFHLRNCGLRMVFEVTPRSLKFLGYYSRDFSETLVHRFIYV